MFTKRFRRNTAAVMIGLSLTTPLIVHADMRDAMDNMFVSITNPGAYRSQNRMGAVGGYASIRMPNQNINVLTLDMPRISMGCGGIDMFGGSFSFINADRLIAVMRNIGQIAVAALFKLAIAAISKELSGNMSEFLSFIQWLNNIKLNSCKIGEHLGGQMAKTLLPDAETASGNQQNLNAAKGKDKESFQQWFEGLFGKDFGNTPPDPDNPSAGNLTWRALYRSEAYQRVYVGQDQSMAAMLIMNIGGTRIVPLGKTSKACQSAPDTALCIAPSIDVKKSINMEMLIAPNDNNVVTTFTDNSLNNEFSWANIQEQKLKEIFPGGTTALAYKILFGKAAAGDGSPEALAFASSDPKGGIVFYVENGNWGDFPEAEMYLSSMTAPVLRSLVLVQREPAAIRYLATTYAPVLATEMAVQFATELANAAQQAFKGDVADKIKEPPDYYKNVQEFRREITAYRAKRSEEIDMKNKLIELSKNVAKSLGSGSMSLPGK